MKHLFAFLLFTVICLLTLNSCKNTDTGIGPEAGYKNPNDMTWTCDTLLYGNNSAQTMLWSLYGTSAKNIWACGHCDGGDGKLWRYNGSGWSAYPLFNDIASSPTGLFKLTSFEAGNVWAAGSRDYWDSDNVGYYKPLILNFRDNKWVETTPEVGNLNTRILSISGNSSNDFWMCGDNGNILHYYYGKWSTDVIKLNQPKPTSYLLKDIVIYKGKPFIMANLNDVPNLYIKTYFYTGSMKDWTKVDSSVIDQTHYYVNGGNLGFYVSNTGRLFSYGEGGVWEWVNNRWSGVLRGEYTIAGMKGLGDNYIFAVGNPSFFYDGVKWSQLKFLEGKNGENLYYKDAWIDGKEVFITGYNTGDFPNKTYMWHGK